MQARFTFLPPDSFFRKNHIRVFSQCGSQACKSRCARLVGVDLRIRKSCQCTNGKLALVGADVENTAWIDPRSAQSETQAVVSPMKVSVPQLKAQTAREEQDFAQVPQFFENYLSTHCDENSDDTSGQFYKTRQPGARTKQDQCCSQRNVQITRQCTSE